MHHTRTGTGQQLDLIAAQLGHVDGCKRRAHQAQLSQTRKRSLAEVLVRITRTPQDYEREVLERVTFVPLLGGVA